MATPPGSDDGDLFFEQAVRGYVEDNPRFLRRAWLADALEAKVRHAGRRFVLLTAVPGAGKSSLIAQLAHAHANWLRYFIRRDQRTVLADVSTKSLLLRIGYQLAALQPLLFSSNQLRVSVEQRIGHVANSGQVIGAEVERLTASPFYRQVLNIRQHVEANHGQLIGIRVAELIVESRLLTVEDLLSLALIDPAQALQRIDPRQQIVILIDALDEIRYHSSGENILSWLTNCCALPENIRFVLTSRPTEELKLFCQKQPDQVAELAIEECDPNVTQDAERFVGRLIEEGALARVLAQVAGGAQTFADKAITKAKGNLGYLAGLARGLDMAITQDKPEMLQALLSLDELPEDLEDLYGFFLQQIKAAVRDQSIEFQDDEGKTHQNPAWLTVYARILGVLAVAMEPLDLDLIERLAGIRVDRAWVNDAIERLQQFLDVHNHRYRLYHSTLAEFLTAERTAKLDASLYRNPRQWHLQIANSYWNERENDWRGCDRYGLRHLAAHLYEADESERLCQLLSPDQQDENTWYTAKAMNGDLDAWEADVELALQLAERNAVVHLQIRYALCLSSGRSIGVPSTLLDLCVQEKVVEWPQALSMAKSCQDPAARAELISRLVSNLPDGERERVVVDEFEKSVGIQADRQRFAIWSALANCLPENRIGDLLELTKRLEEESLQAGIIARYAPRLSEQSAETALELSRSIADPVSKLRSLGALAAREGRLGLFFNEVRSIKHLEPNNGQVQVLCELAWLLKGESRDLLIDEALAIAQRLDYSSSLASALVAFAHPDISKQRLDEVLGFAKKTFREEEHPGTEEGYVSVLVVLGPFLSREQRLEYFGDLVASLQRRRSNRDLPLLAPYLPEDQQAEIFAKYTGSLIADAGTTGKPFFGAQQYGLFPTWRYDAALRALAQWPEPLLDEALDRATRLNWDERRAGLLRVIVERLPQDRRPSILRDELDRMRNINDSGERTKALAALVRYLPDSLKKTTADEALQSSELLSPNERVRIIAMLANYLSPASALPVVQQAILRIRQMKSGQSQAAELAALVPFLPETAMGDALEIVRCLADDHLALAILIGLLPEVDRPHVIEQSLKAIQGWRIAEIPRECVRALEALLPYMESSQVVRAIEIVKKIPPYHQTETALALTILAPRLPTSQRKEALDIAQSLSDKASQIRAVAAFHPDLARQMSTEALAGALTTEQDDQRAILLCKLLPHLTGGQRREAFRTMLRSCLGIRIVHTVGSTVTRRRIDRGFLLARIAEIADTITDIGGANCAAQVVSAIRKTAQWWP